jgi:YHS domain-containing protein
MAGFDVVKLHDQQQWQRGLKSVVASYDGQRYFFSSARQRAIFLAAPHRYTPALGGQCVVTYVESGRRVAGDLKRGILYQGRIYLFLGAAGQRQFQAEPDKYQDADLANAGNCPVTQQDQQRTVPGSPATLHIHHGYRYLFANTAARNRFLRSPDRYVQENVQQVPLGQEMAQDHTLRAARSPANDTLPTQEAAADSMLSVSVPRQQQADIHHQSAPQRLPGPIRKPREKISGTLLQGDSELPAMKPAMGGFCPVSIQGDGQDLGVWVEGNESFQVIYDGKLYLFAGAREKSWFLAAPERYVPALGGECVVCHRDLDQEVHGSIFHAAIYRGRLFLFANAEQKQAFKQDPAVYDLVDLALAGKCVVSQREESRQVDGDENYCARYHNRRYLFASPEYRQKFIATPERYVGP